LPEPALPSDDYEYRGLVAQSWDLLRGDTSAWPDRLFYRALIEQQRGPALDVGCGTGRLMLDYLAAGLDVDGVDNSPDMLALCRTKAAAMDLEVEGRLFLQEMETLTLSRRYATIFVPSSSFQLLTDLAAADRAMRRFYEHLAPRGMLVMSIMSKLWRGRPTPPQMQWSDWRKLAERRREEDSATVRRWIRTRYDHENQLEHEENRYEVLRDDIIIQSENHRRSPAVRWYSQSQVIAAYERAGFTDVKATSGFTFEPASPEDTTFCVIGARP
jgi:SAM-dependent methyltransferase